jgi:hypothetical protein
MTKMPKKKISRRKFLGQMAVTGGILSLGPTIGNAFQFNKNQKNQLPSTKDYSFLKNYGPIDKNISFLDGQQFLGDQPQLKAHPILWDKTAFLKQNKLPPPKEEVPLVIVGGGMSGLISAYLLRHHNPIVLEQSARFGGNAQGEAWNGVTYSVGAAYYMEQQPGSELYKLFEEVGAHSISRIKKEEDPTILGNKIYENFWSGETDHAKLLQFEKLKKYFIDVYKETNDQQFPKMPLSVLNFSDDFKGTSLLIDLDKYNFKTYLEKKVLEGQKLHPHIEAMLEHYCWSTFGSALQEVSAAAGLNAYASEFGNCYVAPGGNSAVAECFLKKTLETVPEKNLRTQALVVDVEAFDNYTIVTYSDSLGVLHSLKAKVAIMACPKFIVKYVLRDIEPERLNAIGKLKYRAYLVGNALIDQNVEKSFYDLYLLDGGIDPDQSQITDVISSQYSQNIKQTSSVLTLYRGFPFDSGRINLYDNESFKFYKEEMLKQLNDQIFPSLKIKKENLKSLRITRWGHPMPVPSPGLIADGTIETIRRPFKKRVFFIEQDNWMLAAVETAAEEALFWCKEIKALLA